MFNRRTSALCFLGLLLSADVWGAKAPEDSVGTVLGRVLACSPARPVPWANVIFLGTRRGTVTGDDGRFEVSLVPTGAWSLRILAGGHEPLTQAVTIHAGDNQLGDIMLGSASRDEPVPDRIPAATRALVGASELVAEIRPTRPRFKVGESPTFVVRIHNRGPRPVVLAAFVEGSSLGASPRGEIRIAAPFDAFKPRSGRGIMFCATSRTLGIADFIEVGPGEAFDPYLNGDFPPELAEGTLTRPGHYTATFRYATTDSILSHWMGSTQRCASREIRELVARVPAIELEAKTHFKVDF